MSMVLDRIGYMPSPPMAAGPTGLYLLRRDGRIAFQGGEGPFGFKPEELRAIQRELVG